MPPNRMFGTHLTSVSGGKSISDTNKKCSGWSHLILVSFLCQSSPTVTVVRLMSSPRLGGAVQNTVDRHGIL